jgi:phage-related protein
MAWTITYYSDQVQREIMSLPTGFQARYIHLARRMLEYGPNLGMPHTRAIGDGLFELRMKLEEGIGRALYCALVGNRIVMPHAFIKKTARTPENDLAIARRRIKEVKTNA